MDLNSDFWAHPPWEGKNKHRLGLRPIDLSEVWVHDDELLSNKRLQLECRYEEVVATLPGYEAYAWELPGIAEVGRHYPDWIGCIGALVAEDVCILDTQDNNRLIAGCLAAPSYWSLRDKMGLPLHDVHAPVEGMNQKIGGRIADFFQRLPLGRPFRRENWFVHGEAVYFRQTPGLRTKLSADPEGWFIRSERQTLLRLDERFVVFVIGIVFARFTDMQFYPDAIRSFKASLLAMDDDEITHFGGHPKFTRIKRFIDAL